MAKDKGAGRRKFGTRVCRECSERVFVFINDQDTLGYSCQNCGDRGYVRKNESDRYRDWLSKITVTAAPAAPAAAPADDGKGAAPANGDKPAPRRVSMLG